MVGSTEHVLIDYIIVVSCGSIGFTCDTVAQFFTVNNALLRSFLFFRISSTIPELWLPGGYPREKMARAKLTPGFVQKAKVEFGSDRTIYWDEKLERFGLMVTKAGHKSFVYQYRDRVTRKQSRMTFAFDLGLKRAKSLAENARLRVRLGGNPLSEIRKAAALAENTLESISEEYLKRRAAELRSKKKIQSALERLVYPRLGSRQVAEIRRSEISRLLEDIADEQGPVAADYTLSVVRRIMNWHASRSDDFRSPIVPGMAQTKPSERKRERILTDDELRAIWKASEGFSGPFGSLLRFILLTACRRTEAAAMTYSEVVGADWMIPAARYKTKRNITLPLSKAAQEVLASIPRVGGIEFVFTGGRVRVSGFGPLKARFDKACGVTGWTIHDLRRTARSLMARAGVPSDHAERCLGHLITGVEGTYDRHDYYDHMTRAFEALAAQIDRIINPQPNVIPMRSEIPA